MASDDDGDRKKILEEPMSEDDCPNDSFASQSFELEGDKVSINCICEERLQDGMYRPFNAQVDILEASGSGHR